MIWLLYTLLCALLVSLKDVILKKILGESNILIISLGFYLISIALIFPFLFIIDIPKLDLTFWIMCLIILPFDISSLLLYYKAIKISPLSICMPFLSLTPFFLILTSFIILRELPDKSGLAGIVLVVLGAYVLNIHDIKSGFFSPFKSILKEKGAILMILVAFIFSISSNMVKIAINHSSPAFFSIVYNSFLIPVLLILSLLNARSEFSQLIRYKKFILLGGICLAGSIVLNNLAIKLALVPYFISVKRSSIIFDIILGSIIFKEKNISSKLFGSFIMIAGIILITFH